MTRGRPPGDPGVPPGSARVAALRLLGRRDYSAAEVSARLLARGYPEDVVRATVAALLADGTIDDLRTAMAHVRTAAGVKRRGSRRIQRELEARGLAPDTVQTALGGLTPDDDLAAIRRLLARRPLPTPLPADARRRLFQQLLRRGFPADLIARALGADADDG
jgi:regulatory protein